MKSSTVQIDTLLKENSLLKDENARLRQTLSDHNIEYPQLNSPVQEHEALKGSDSGALIESEERYNSLFKNATLGIAHCRTITDEKGAPVDYVILRVNDTYTDLTGLVKEDVEGKTAKEVFPGIENFSFDYIGNYGKIALEGGELNFEEYFEGLNQWYSIYIYSPKKYEFTAFFTDISDRKRAEAALRKSREELKSITDNSPYIIGRFDLNYRHIFINPFGEKVYGRKRDEIIGKTVRELGMPREKALYLENHILQ